MSEPFLGQITLTGFDFAPKGYAACNGQLLPINQNQALFSLLGTRFGGNGTTTFALPDLRGRVPLHAAAPGEVGQSAGQSSVTLTPQQIPAHTHPVDAVTGDGTSPSPTGNKLAGTPGHLYSAPPASTTLAADASGATGDSQPHPNLQPYTVIGYCIALQGIFPSRN